MQKKPKTSTPPQNSRTYLFGGFFFIVLTYIGLKYCYIFEIGVINVYIVEYKSVWKSAPLFTDVKLVC